MNDEISVIIPLYNGRTYIGQAVESVLNQTFVPMEILIVNDGSSDNGAARIPDHPRVRIIGQPNSGVAAARNRGVRESIGNMLAFLDQDDTWVPEKLEKQVAYLREHAELGYVLAHQLIRLAAGVSRPAWLKPDQVNQPSVGYLPGTLVVRRETFHQVGPFNETYKSGSDSEWFFRAKDMGVPMHILPDVLLHRTIHEKNQSHDTATANVELLRMVRQSLKNRRNLQ